jgi:hypothetical protein
MLTQTDGKGNGRITSYVYDIHGRMLSKGRGNNKISRS